MSTLLILAALCLQPADTAVVEERCATIVLEHFYDGNGNVVFDQHIFLTETLYPGDWLVEDVISWRLVKAPDQIVNRDKDGGWYMLWNDGATMRLVRARSYRETHSQVDSELAAREFLPVHERRGLRGAKPIVGRPPFVFETPAETP